MEVFKSVGDCLFAALGLVVGLSAVHKPFEEKFKAWSSHMTKRPWIRRLSGTVFIVFCLLYLYTAISIPLQQKKDQKEERAKAEAQQAKAEAQLETVQKGMEKLDSYISDLQK